MLQLRSESYRLGCKAIGKLVCMAQQKPCQGRAYQVIVRPQELHPQLVNTVRLSQSSDRSYDGGINVDREHVQEFHR